VYQHKLQCKLARPPAPAPQKPPPPPPQSKRFDASADDAVANIDSVSDFDTFRRATPDAPSILLLADGSQETTAAAGRDYVAQVAALTSAGFQCAATQKYVTDGLARALAAPKPPSVILCPPVANGKVGFHSLRLGDGSASATALVAWAQSFADRWAPVPLDLADRGQVS